MKGGGGGGGGGLGTGSSVYLCGNVVESRATLSSSFDHMVFISYKTDEDPRGRNVLLELDLQLRECSSTLHKSISMCEWLEVIDMGKHTLGWRIVVGTPDLMHHRIPPPPPPPSRFASSPFTVGSPQKATPVRAGRGPRQPVHCW